MGSKEDLVHKSPKRVQMTIGDHTELQTLFSDDEKIVERPATLDPSAIRKASSCRFTVQNVEPAGKNTNGKSVPIMDRLGDDLAVEMEEPIADNHRSHSSSRFKREI